MRKLLILVLCGFAHRSACTRVRFEPFHEPMCRQDPHIHGDAVYKREHFFPRDAIVQPEQILQPQGMMLRNGPLYGTERMLPHPPPQQSGFSNEDFLPNNQLMQGEPIMQNEAFMRAEPILRRDPFIRREPLFRREPFIRGEPLIPRGRIYQNAPILPDGEVFRSKPSPYAVMMTQCQCQEGVPRVEQAPPQETFLQISQPVQQQPLIGQFIIPKQSIKSQVYQPILAFPRFQRLVRKSFNPIPDNFQFAAPPVQNPPEFNTFTNEPVPFPGNFPTQGTQTENTSEPTQNKPVTVRTLQPMPNALTLAQMSSIC